MPSAADFRALALGWPEAEEIETWGHPTFRVRSKMFGSMAEDGSTATVKATKDAQTAHVRSEPDVFFVPKYVGVHGWIGVQLEAVDADVLAELVEDAWAMTAPKRLQRG